MPSPPGSHRDLLHTEPIWHHSKWSLLLSPTSPGHGRHVLPQLSIAAMQCKACMPVHVSWQVIGTWSIECPIFKAALGMHPHRVSSPSHGTANPWISSSLHGQDCHGKAGNRGFTRLEYKTAQKGPSTLALTLPT